MKRITVILIFSFSFLVLVAQNKFKDPRDGNSYRTITLAGVTWMAENLKYKPSEGGAFYFDNDTNNVSRYGILYEWNTAMKVCPDGWHLPTGSEFRVLMNHIEKDDAWENAASGPISFSIQLAGMQDHEGTFTEMDESAYFWTSTEYSKDDAEYFSYLVYNGSPVSDLSRKDDVQDIHGSEKSNKYSVRCVRNQ
jgi:uncharacterized protein (TIGR02145 family)